MSLSAGGRFGQYEILSLAVAPDGRAIVGTNAAHVSDEIWILTSRP
jgi:hypothetical protein